MVPSRAACHGFLLFFPHFWMSWLSLFLPFHHQPHPVLSCLMSHLEHFPLPILLPHRSSCQFLPKNVNACPLTAFTQGQFSPQIPSNVLVGPLSIPAWRDLPSLGPSPHWADKPTGSKRGPFLLTLIRVYISPPHCERLDHSPFSTLPSSSGPLFTSILTPPSSCKGSTLPLKSQLYYQLGGWY